MGLRNCELITLNKGGLESIPHVPHVASWGLLLLLFFCFSLTWSFHVFLLICYVICSCIGGFFFRTRVRPGWVDTASRLRFKGHKLDFAFSSIRRLHALEFTEISDWDILQS